jgi:hypothetical protein
MMARLSMLCLYLRLFFRRGVKYIVYALIAINVLSGMAFIFASIFQCIPVHAAWTRWDGTVQAKCINVNAVGWASAAINIILDAVIIVLPFPELIKLMISWEQKISICIMFSLGSL